MDLFASKILCAVLAVVLSLAFGFLPLTFSGRCAITIDPCDPNYKRTRKGNQILAFLLNFGGGVLIANCFCHWLPEVREGIEHRDIDTVLPLAEVIMCCGFFFICFLEEVIHLFLHSHMAREDEERKERRKRKSRRVAPAVAADQAAETQMQNCKNGPQDEEKSGENGGMNHVDNQRGAVTDADSEEEAEALAKEKNRELERTLSAIRTFFVVFALSFHSVIEGLALSLEEDASGVWLNFGAMAMHKFVIAFAVGVELISVQASKTNYSVSTVVFALAPALGIAIGMVLTGESGGEDDIDDFAIQVLQGIATGTIVYVVFFEIFPKAREIGGSGFRSILAMALGFGIFLPSLLFHTHDHEESSECADAHQH